MFYQARYYSAVLGRFLSADTMVPSPANPQSLNRYAYVLNSSLRYTDPTGRYWCPAGSIHCIDDTSRSYSVYRKNLYGIRFTADAGQSWHIRDRDAVVSAATRIASALWHAQANSYQIGGVGLDPAILDMPGPVTLFRQTMGNVIYHQSTYSCPDPRGCWASVDNPRITVYTNAPHGGYTSHNAAHEMGHLLAQRTGWSRGTLRAYADLNAAQISYTDDRGRTINVAGGGWPGLGYQRTDLGYATVESPWQQNWWTPTPNEDFADMFLGWAYNHFADNPAGAVRYQWMNVNMPRWMALAVSATP